jgi:hypothetical protein
VNLNREKLWEMMGYEPHAGQWLIHNSDARFKVATCGRRWGKSTSAVFDIIPDLFIPNQLWWLCGPTYELGEREFRVLWDAIYQTPICRHKDFNSAFSVKQGNMFMKFPWGTYIKVVSAEKPKSLQGIGLNGVIMCEAGEHERFTWDKYIRPALSDKRGRALFPSTPKGFNYFYEFFMRGQSSDFPQWESWQFPTWTNTAVFSGRDDEEIIEAERSMSQMMFDQEYGAQFTAFEGRIYDEFQESIHVTDIEYNPAWRNYWSFDFGFSNPFVCLDVMVDRSDNVYVWREYYKRFMATMEHGRALRQRPNPAGFHVDAMFGDPSGADEIATLALILGAVWGRKVGWKEGIEAIKSRLKVQPDGKPKLFIDPSCKNLIRELQTLRMAGTTRAGAEKNPREIQHQYDDHCCDALRYFASEFFVLGAGSSLLSAYKYESNAAGNPSFFVYDQEANFKTDPNFRW